MGKVGDMAAGCAVLLIDHEDHVRQLAAQILRRRLGCTVDVASSLAEAKALMAARPQDAPYFAAVADLHLPDAAPELIISTLIHAKLVVIGITDQYDKAMRNAMLMRGVADYFTKCNNQIYRYVADQVRQLWLNRGKHALVVDDSAATRNLVKAWLERQQITVHLAANGSEALDVMSASADPVHIVVTDCHMPGMDGFELVSQLRRKYGREHLAIIGVSSSVDPTQSARFLKQGANDYLNKPFVYEELCARINQNLAMLDIFATLRDQAERDVLTGLHNRRYFYDRVAAKAAQPLVDGRGIVVMMMDIDFFKRINDNFGHPAGDAVLCHVARLLAEHYSDALVARFGGEEFAVILTELPQVAKARAEAFCNALQASTIAHDSHLLACTISIGLCQTPGMPPLSMLSRADALLYEAKNGGRNQVRCCALASN